jgi:hypothetical protein
LIDRSVDYLNALLRETDRRLKRLLAQNRSVLAGSPCRRVAVADEPNDDTGLPSWAGRFVDRAGWKRDRLSRQKLGT